MGLAQVEIILAMIGREMDDAGAAIGGYKIAGQHRARFSIEPAEFVHRVAGEGSSEFGAFEHLFDMQRKAGALLKIVYE